MCGIAGVIDLDGTRRPAPSGVVARMSAAILHRGPDEEGYLERAGLHLANRRLSIVGLADGQQPLANEDSSIWTVFNGELFDYREQRRDLEARGHQFRTHTDTELLPHLWEEHREQMLEHVRGQFALCIWDSQTHEFLLARDRAGICPLFYSTVAHDGTNWLVFASEMKAILASGLIPAQPDLTGIGHVFTFFAMPGPRTVFRGIQALLPGRYLHIKPGQADLTQRTYWQVTYPDRGQEHYGANEKQVVNGFEQVLMAAIDKRLKADVPVVSYLSGGVDSSLVVAMASKVLGRPIPTFTVSVQKEGMNEETEALQTARHLGCTPLIVKCGDEELRADYPELIAAAECPVIDTACLGLMHLARAVRQAGYKVALTGEGADEWLAGYPWFKIHKVLSVLDQVPEWRGGYRARMLAMKLAGNPTTDYEQYSYPEKLLGGRNGWLDIYGMMALNKLRFFQPEVLDELQTRSPYDDLELPHADLQRWHPFHRQMYLGARVMLPGHLLASKGDRVAMHNSVEVRYPFLDENVIAYMAQLHPRWKLRGLLKDKYIERKVAQRWLPKEVAWRRKLMFRAPMDSWVNPEGTGASPWISRILSKESLSKVGWFRPEAVQQAQVKLGKMGKRAPGRAGLEMGLTAVIATQLWYDLFIEKLS